MTYFNVRFFVGGSVILPIHRTTNRVIITGINYDSPATHPDSVGGNESRIGEYVLESQRYSGSQRLLIPIAFNKVMVRKALNINSQSTTRNKEVDDEIKPVSSGYQITPSDE